jgi:cellulose synthase/poly-beta-1,6-N-acetylglucosamine synthase-like glycosyltransferase
MSSAPPHQWPCELCLDSTWRSDVGFNKSLRAPLPSVRIGILDRYAQLRVALLRASPRYRPRPVSLRSILIYVVVLGLWLIVLAGALTFSGVLTWAAGLLYVTYDTLLLFYVFLSTRHLLRCAPSGAPASADRSGGGPRAAVIIAARNELAALPRTIAALLSQTQALQMILVVDDGSTDGTLRMLRERYGVKEGARGGLENSSQIPTLAWLHRPHGGKALALNAGLAHIAADIVLTVDADTILEPGAVAAVCGAFRQEPQLVAACGVLRPVVEKDGAGLNAARRFFQWFQTYEYIRASLSRAAWMRADAMLLVSGAFAAFRLDALLTVGGFDANCLVEDYELIHRLHRWSYEQGTRWTVRVIGGARGATDVPGTLPAFMRQRRRWFAGFLQTQWWNRDMTGNSRYGLLGRVMMPVKAIDTLQPVYGLTAFCLLLWFAAHGRSVLLPVSSIIAGKIIIDLAFHLWSVRLYSVWTGEPAGGARFGLAFVAALAEPFSFQLMRHSGAVWGWWAFLSGRLSWGAVPAPESKKKATYAEGEKQTL